MAEFGNWGYPTASVIGLLITGILFSSWGEKLSFLCHQCEEVAIARMNTKMEEIGNHYHNQINSVLAAAFVGSRELSSYEVHAFRSSLTREDLQVIQTALIFSNKLDGFARRLRFYRMIFAIFFVVSAVLMIVHSIWSANEFLIKSQMVLSIVFPLALCIVVIDVAYSKNYEEKVVNANKLNKRD